MSWIIWLPFVLLAILAPYAARQALQRRRALAAAVGSARPHYHKGHVVSLSVPVQTRLRFLLLRENDDSRRLRMSGELVEPQTGHALFDLRYFLESDDPELAPWLASDQQARELIEALIGDGRALRLEKGRLALNGRGDLDDLALLSQLSDRLVRLAERVPKLTRTHPNAAAPDRVVGQLRALILGIGAAAGGLWLYTGFSAHFPQNASSWPLWLGGAIVGALPAWPLYRWIVRRARISARARSLRGEAAGLLVPLVLIGALGAPQINLRLSASPIIEEQASISGLERGRRGRRWVAIASPGELPHQQWRCSQAFHHRARTGQRVLIRWRTGIFGIPVLLEEPRFLPERKD